MHYGKFYTELPFVMCLIKKIWPLYHGRRAVKLVKSKETLCCFTIESVHHRAAKTKIALNYQQGHNPTNCNYN